MINKPPPQRWKGKKYSFFGGEGGEGGEEMGKQLSSSLNAIQTSRCMF